MEPMIMPANLNTLARGLEDRFPGRMGLLFGLKAWADPKGLPYALDNGRFPVWDKGLAWDARAYRDLVRRAEGHAYPPIWAAVPDVVADADATLGEWDRWHRRLRARLRCPLALVVQDGMTPGSVSGLRPAPDVIFVGGTKGWKWRTLIGWCQNFPRVHVGRVNTKSGLLAAEAAGAESSDGTGWWHRKQFRQLEDYLAGGHRVEGLFS